MPLAHAKQFDAKRKPNSGELAVLCAVFGYLNSRGQRQPSSSARQLLSMDRLAGANALTRPFAEARVLRGFVFDVFGCLTFEVT
jgi:hypothetical protein